MPLQVESWDVLKEYIEGTPGARAYFRVSGKKLTVVAGMLSWTGDCKNADEYQVRKEFLEAHNAVEVSGYRDVRELFS